MHSYSLTKDFFSVYTSKFFEVVVDSKGILFILDNVQRKAWRFCLPEFDYDEVVEELKAIENVPRGTNES